MITLFCFAAPLQKASQSLLLLNDLKPGGYVRRLPSIPLRALAVRSPSLMPRDNRANAMKFVSPTSGNSRAASAHVIDYRTAPAWTVGQIFNRWPPTSRP
jgi:hypothetical protein